MYTSTAGGQRRRLLLFDDRPNALTEFHDHVIKTMHLVSVPSREDEIKLIRPMTMSELFRGLIRYKRAAEWYGAGQPTAAVYSVYQVNQRQRSVLREACHPSGVG